MALHALRNWLKTNSLQLPSLYLVGGSVRDLLLNNAPKDLDMVCKKADELAYALAKEKNAAVVAMAKKPWEPCYRIVDRDSPSNFLDIAEMRGETIYEDLENRDFTINAIAMEINSDGRTGAVIDPLHGAEDLKRKIIRLAGEKAVISDPLRILRAFRFAATLGFDIEPAALEEIKNHVGLLTTISNERIIAELLLILKAPTSSSSFRQMDRLNILESIFPEIAAMKGCPQNGFHNRDAWEHSMLTMENCEHIINNPADFFEAQAKDVTSNLAEGNRLPLLKLAALLHDIGKPLTKGLNPDTGRITFYRHDEEGARLARLISERLKMSNADKEFLSVLTAERLHVISLANKAVRPATIMRWFRKMGDNAIPEIILSMADTKSTNGTESTEEFRDYYVNWARDMAIKYYKGIKLRLERQSLISGADLMAIGMDPGPKMGNVLDAIRDAQDSGEISSREDAIDMAKNLLGALY